MIFQSGIREAESYLDQVHLVEAVIATRLLDVENRNDILMVEVPEELHLTQRSETEHGVVEWSDLLDGNLLARGLMYRGAANR